MKPLPPVRSNIQHLLPESLFSVRSLPLAAIALVFLSGCSVSTAASSKPKGAREAVVPVVVAKAAQKTVPLEVRSMGTVEAYAVVSVKSQVSGELQGVYFTEGQDVRKGDLLFKIDSRSFEAALMQAEGNRAKDIAQVEQAKAKLAADEAQVEQAKAKVTADMAQVQQAKAKVAADAAQIKQAEANLTKENAQARQANVEADRYKQLLNEGAIALNEYDRLRSTAEQMNASAGAGSAGVENARAALGASAAGVENARAAVEQSRAAVENARAAVAASQAAVKNAEAAVAADSAAVENARIQLGYTSIYAPMDGRAGSLAVNQGNAIKANDTALVEIEQINPIYVSFTVPQLQLPLIRKYMDGGDLRVKAIVPKDEARPLEGTLTFIDNAVDKTTGTVKLKATFDNPDRRLWPGQFVNAIVELTRESDAIVVPARAVQTGQKGQYVFVVKPDLTVENRPVVVSRTVGGESVISQGIEPSDTVVTDGQLKLVPGAKVSVKDTKQEEKKKP